MRQITSVLVYAFLFVASTHALAAASMEKDAVIHVDFKTATLRYEEDGSVVAHYPTVLPRKPYTLPVTGEVIRVIVGAAWYPTKGTRAAYYRKHNKELPKKVPAGSPLNAMGAGKIRLKFNEPHMQGIYAAVRIHGNAREKDLGKKISRGCIRLRDPDFLALAQLIGDRKPRLRFSYPE